MRTEGRCSLGSTGCVCVGLGMQGLDNASPSQTPPRPNREAQGRRHALSHGSPDAPMSAVRRPGRKQPLMPCSSCSSQSALLSSLRLGTK